MSAPPGSTGSEPASEELRVGSAPRGRTEPPEMGGFPVLEVQLMRRPLAMRDCKGERVI